MEERIQSEETKERRIRIDDLRREAQELKAEEMAKVQGGILEKSGLITNTQFTFDTTIF